MGNKLSVIKINGVSYAYSGTVQPRTREEIQRTIFDAQQKCSNNTFFEGLNLNVYSTWEESSTWRNTPDTQKGLTTYPIFDIPKNIYLQTDENPEQYGGILPHYTNYFQIKENTLHELGHIFDYNFATPDPDIFEKLKKMIKFDGEISEAENAEFDKLLTEYRKNNGLSDSEEFKQAWKKDVEKSFKGISKFNTIIKNDKLGYFSPTHEFNNDNNNNEKKINPRDGIDDIELDLSDRTREEVFAQLFAYALGAKGNTHNRKFILQTYKNSYEVVQKFVQKYLGY